MDWHSTAEREELLVVFAGRVAVDIRSADGRIRTFALYAGRCMILPPQTRHRVLNRSRASARYVYVTAPIK